MIQYLQHNSINKEKWDECIDKSINGYAYVYSWYLDAVYKNWSALVLNDYEAVFPMALKSKFNINFLYQPFFTRYFGVFAKTAIHENMVNDFFDAIPQKIKFIEFNIHESNPFYRADYQNKERFFQLIDLKQTYENIKKDYKGDALRNIKKAEKNNLKIIDNVEPELIVALFKQNKGKQLKEILSKDYLSLLEIMNAANRHQFGTSIGICNANNAFIAAAFFIRTNNRILFLKGSANAEGKSSGAMYLIIDVMLKTYAQKAESFDFGGSSIESIANFNHNFGGKNYVYLQVKKNNLPYFIKLISSKK